MVPIDVKNVHTNWKSNKHTIAMVMNCPVGVGFKVDMFSRHMEWPLSDGD